MAWTTFDLERSKKGTLVGLEQSDLNDISMTGLLHVENGSQPPYRVALNGKTVWCNEEGVIKKSPDNALLVNQTLKNFSVDLSQDPTIVITRSGGGTATMSSTTPRDQFAMEVLQAIINQTKGAPDLDDAAMLNASNTAYRWAQAMMFAASSYRKSDTDTNPDPSTDIAEAIDKMVIRNAQTTGTNPVDIPLKTSLVDGSNNVLGTSAHKLEVNVTGGGGGGGGSVNLDDLIEALGYDADASITQASKLDSLIQAVTNSGRIKKGDVDATNFLANIEHILVFSDLGNNPYKVTPTNLAKLLKVSPTITTVSTFNDTLYTDYYYYCSAQLSTTVNLWLPTFVSAPTEAKMIMVNLTVAGTATPAINVAPFASSDQTPVKWRGTKLTTLEAGATYEIDIVHNGYYWTVGATKIVNN